MRSSARTTWIRAELRDWLAEAAWALDNPALD